MTPMIIRFTAPMRMSITPREDGRISITISPSHETAPAWAHRLLAKIGVVIEKEDQIMSAQTDALDQAEAAAKSNSDADDAAEALLLELVRLYNEAAANSTDPQVLSRIQALSTALTDRAARLSAAVVAGTPAAKP